MVKGVRSYIINIVLIMVVVLISIPLWFNEKNNKAYSLASSFNDINIYLTISDYDYKLNNNSLLKSYDVIIRNQNDFNKDYTLLIKLEQKDNVNYDKIMINNKVLTDYNYKISNGYYLIYIDYNNIDGYTNREYTIDIEYNNYLVSNLYTEFLIR